MSSLQHVLFHFLKTADRYLHINGDLTSLRILLCALLCIMLVQNLIHWPKTVERHLCVASKFMTLRTVQRGEVLYCDILCWTHSSLQCSWFALKPTCIHFQEKYSTAGAQTKHDKLDCQNADDMHT